jgi:hypothetical protein
VGVCLFLRNEVFFQLKAWRDIEQHCVVEVSDSLSQAFDVAFLRLWQIFSVPVFLDKRLESRKFKSATCIGKIAELLPIKTHLDSAEGTLMSRFEAGLVDVAKVVYKFESRLISSCPRGCCIHGVELTVYHRLVQKTIYYLYDVSARLHLKPVKIKRSIHCSDSRSSIGSRGLSAWCCAGF